MKSILLCVILSVVSVQSFSETWNLSEILDGKDVTGYIYHTNDTKYKSSLRLICSTKEYDKSPIIAILQDGLVGSGQKTIQIKVDGKDVEYSKAYSWTQDGSLVYRNINESRALIQSMRIGSNIKFNIDGKKESTFDLRDLKYGFPNFNSICKSKI